MLENGWSYANTIPHSLIATSLLYNTGILAKSERSGVEVVPVRMEWPLTHYDRLVVAAQRELQASGRVAGGLVEAVALQQQVLKLKLAAGKKKRTFCFTWKFEKKKKYVTSNDDYT